MSKLQGIPINLTKERVLRLKKGYPVQFNYSDIGQGPNQTPIYLSKRNINRTKKAFKLRKGIRLSLTLKEIKYNAKHGSGFFDDVWNGIKRAAEIVGPKVLNAGADALVRKIAGGGKRRSRRAKRGGELSPAMVEMYKNFKPKFLGHVVSAGPQPKFGGGPWEDFMAKVRKNPNLIGPNLAKLQNGGNLWDDWKRGASKIGRFLKPVAEKGWQIAKPIAEKGAEKLAEKGLEALMRKISGGKVKRRKARGLRLPGHGLSLPGRRRY